MKLRIFSDTSVIGGCLDDEFKNESQRFIESVRAGECTLLLSDVVIGELNKAPIAVQQIITALPKEHIEFVPITQEVLLLRNAYLESKIISERWIDDASHVAAATIARADAIVSWNFRHIVRLDKMKAYNQINLLRGYGILTIISPKEINYDDFDSN